MVKYNIEQYVNKLEEAGLLVRVGNIDKTKEIDLVSYNSKEVVDNTLFVCKGLNFKDEYVEYASRLGAVAYIADEEKQVHIPGIIVKNVQEALAVVSDLYYSHPQDKLNIIGLTGTKGKSTTSFYIKYILDDYAKAVNKKETAIISTVVTYDGVINEPSHITTPESLMLQQHFSNAANTGIENVVMEVSSQALKYGRVHTVDFDISVFLNISEDHISPIEHPDFDDYFNNKLKIFAKSKKTIVNLDMDYAEKMLKKSKEAKKIITFSTKDKNADIYAYDIGKEDFDTVFTVKTNDFNQKFTLTMPGLFNVENALAAIAVAIELNIPLEYIVSGIAKAKASGRMEIYTSEDKKAVAIVDFAHNKLSFEKLFESTKQEYPNRKISIIFGCPGGKGFSRRKDLGTVAGKNADKIYLVPDDPAYENPKEIADEIATYIKEYTENFEYIDSREEAIQKAIGSVRENEVILVAGKGDEDTIKIGGAYVPYVSDVDNVKKCLEEYNKVTIKD